MAPAFINSGIRMNFYLKGLVRLIRTFLEEEAQEPPHASTLRDYEPQ